MAVQFRPFNAGPIVETCPHLSTSEGQHLTERHDGSSAMEVHKVLQKPVPPVLPYYHIMAVLQWIDHEMSAAVVSTEGSASKNEKARTLNCGTE